MMADLLTRLPQDRKIYIHIDGAAKNTKFEVQETVRVAFEYKSKCPSGLIEIFHQRNNLGNLGSFRAAMEWVFSSEEEIIFLEDDIRFTSAFFPYMDWSLSNFRESSRIFHINGLSFLDIIPGRHRLFESYSCRSWGFGTWKRSWELYMQLPPLPIDPEKVLSAPIFDKVELTESFREKWIDRFTRLNRGTDTYDLGWNYTAWINSLYALSPRHTYTTNIGFDSRSLHTKYKPKALRTPEKMNSQSFKSYNSPVIPFPSYYDAYSDFLEWRTPGINSGSATYLNSIFEFAKRLNRLHNSGNKSRLEN
jgi:hypothetical protein